MERFYLPRMIVPLHWLIVACYLVLPTGALVRGVVIQIRTGRSGPVRRFWFTTFGGMLMGGVVCGAHAAVLRGRMLPAQVLLCGYFATAMLLLLKAFDRLIFVGFDRLTGTSGLPRTGLSFVIRQLISRLLRVAVLVAVGLPYVLAACLTYHTHVATSATPQSLRGWSYESVVFRSTDDVRLSGWWIPASDGPSSKTVIFCHGLAGTKATQLFVTGQLVPAGYNVLAFDFRGVGESSGQLVGFGTLESRDVLGAVHWLRTTHPQACGRVLGLGVGTGGAAILAASADPGIDGQTIDAVAVYSGFDRLDLVVSGLANQYLSKPFTSLITRVGLPLASVQCGANLTSFAPAEAAAKLWPRPLLVVQAVDDQILDFARGQALFDQALQPKYNDWVDHVTHEQMLEDENAARFVREFFDSARSTI